MHYAIDIKLPKSSLISDEFHRCATTPKSRPNAGLSPYGNFFKCMIFIFYLVEVAIRISYHLMTLSRFSTNVPKCLRIIK